MMLTLLFVALIGDLVFLPALLAGPLGWFFETRRKAAAPAEPPRDNAAPAPHILGDSPVKRLQPTFDAHVRRDDAH